MAISEQQLETWSNTGADTGSKKAYDRVKNIIDNSSFTKKSEVDIYLQGSYANTTHIRADSDVDVVIQLTSVFSSDISKLSEQEKQEYSKLSTALYSHDHLRQELLNIFTNALGSSKVESRNKCIRLNLGDGQLSVDLTPCTSYRIYSSYPNNYVEGISIKKLDGNTIHNFPKRHINHGIKKHQDTDEYYKKVVRILKNMRGKLTDEGKMAEGTAPSYYVECLAYNIPNNHFGGSLHNSVLNSLKWFSENHNNFSQLKCQNEVSNLFGSEGTQWNIPHCQEFTSAIINLWNGS